MNSRRPVNSTVILLSLMKSVRFWIPLVFSFAVTPFFLFLAFLSAGMGEGNYFLAKIFLPYTMLSTGNPMGAIRQPYIVLALVQYPLYGFILSVANLKRKMLIVGLGLFVIHASAVVACLLLTGNNFH